MTAIPGYASQAPTRDEVDALRGAAVLNFGANWCEHCQAAAAPVQAALAAHPRVRHLRVEDGKGRALGRSFQVKLWPTLVFLKDGVELARVVRPTDAGALAQALQAIDPTL